MMLALIAIVGAPLSLNIFISQDSIAAEPSPVTRIFVLNGPSTKSAGFDSILNFDSFGKSGILFGTQNRVLGARDLVCSPVKPENILLSVTNFSLGVDSILEINAAGNVANVTPGLGGPASGGSALAFDREGNFYIAAAGTIFKNGVPFAALPVNEEVGDLAIDSSGNLYVSYPISSKLFRGDPSGAVTLFADLSDGLISPFGLAVDSADNLFVANGPPSAPGFILKFGPSGTSTVFAKNISFQPGIRSLAIRFDKNDILYVPLFDNNKILVFDSGGNSAVFADETDGVNAPVGIAIGSCPVEEPFVTILNNRVSFVPITSTFKTTSDSSGCPVGFISKFSFSATLTNNSNSSPLVNLTAQVRTLTNGNLLQNADGGPFGATATLSIPRTDGFADGLLSSGESVDVPFDICLENTFRFTFLVDVLGIEGSDVSNSLVQR